MARFKDYLHLHFIVFIWGFTAILGLLINIPSVEVVFYRSLMSSMAVAAIIFLSNSLTFRIERKAVLNMLLVGVVIAVHWILFFASARLANASISLIGLATVALWTSFLEPIVNRRKIQLFEVLLGIVIVIGLLMIYRVNLSYKLGLLLAVISAFLAAVFSVLNGRLASKHHHIVITFYEMAGATVSIFIFIPFYTHFLSSSQAFVWQISWSDFGYLVVLSLVCTVYAFSASIELLKRMSVFASNLTIHMEPIYGILLALIIFGDSEKMNEGFYLGSAIIILAVFSYPVFKYVRPKLSDSMKR